MVNTRNINLVLNTPPSMDPIQAALAVIQETLASIQAEVKLHSTEIASLKRGEGTSQPRTDELTAQLRPHPEPNNTPYGKLIRIEFLKFSGDDVKDWVYRCKQFFKVDGMPDGRKIQLASMHMFDVALVWYQQYVKKYPDNTLWEHFEVEVVKRFGVLYDDPIVKLKNLNGQLHSIEVITEGDLDNYIDGDDETYEDCVGDMVGVTDSPQITFNALSGLNSYQTIRVRGRVGRQLVLTGITNTHVYWMEGNEGMMKQAELSSMALCVYPVQLCQMESVRIVSAEVEHVLTQFAEVFKIPKYLPPQISHDVLSRVDSSGELLQIIVSSVSSGVWDKKGLKKMVKQMIRYCDVCQRQKPNLSAYSGLIQPLPIPERSWKDISMDFIKKLPTSHGKSVILVVVDRLSKYAHFIPLTHPFTASYVAQVFLDQMYKLHGLPESIVSDRDKVFLSNFWKALFAELKVKLKLSTAYHPQTDGHTEVVNRSLKCYLRYHSVGVLPQLREDGLLENKPMTILERRLGKVNNKPVMFVLIQWANKSDKESLRRMELIRAKLEVNTVGLEVNTAELKKLVLLAGVTTASIKVCYAVGAREVHVYGSKPDT
uniref:Putative mitochondrial protein n=1 Tax=Tanacetum cinerariifolium TaxID=118510 RepID=A0A6L2KND6_TANCI|nr:putative mitochondrial protein [Tanacetum cinerariifolium]